MPIWTYTRPPHYAPESVASEKGWEDSETGEVLVAIGELSSKAGSATIRRVEIASNPLVAPDGDIIVHVQYSEGVNVGNDAVLEATITVPGDKTFSSAEITFSEILSGANVVINGTTYTFVDEDPSDYQVLIGGTLLESVENLGDAIMGVTSPAHDNVIVGFVGVDGDNARIILECTDEVDITFTTSATTDSENIIPFSQDPDVVTQLDLVSEASTGSVTVVFMAPLSAVPGGAPAGTTVSIESQTISGDIFDADDGETESEKVISEALASGAGTVTVTE